MRDKKGMDVKGQGGGEELEEEMEGNLYLGYIMWEKIFEKNNLTS